MIDYQKLIPKRGQLVIEWWAMVIRWAKTLPVIIGPNMVATQTPLGMKIKVKTSSPLSTNFEVAVSGQRVRITPGLVEDESPWLIEGRREPIRLNGQRVDESFAPSSEVYFDLENAEPNEDNESAIVVMVQLKNGQFAKPSEFPEGLQILHLTEFDATAKREMIAEERGFQILAKLRWTGGTIRRVTQVANLNLNAFIDDEGRIFFGAV